MNYIATFKKLPKNVGDLGKLIVAKDFKKLPKVQKIVISGHNGHHFKCPQRVSMNLCTSHTHFHSTCLSDHFNMNFIDMTSFIRLIFVLSCVSLSHPFWLLHHLPTPLSLSLLFSLASFPLSRSQLWISFAKLAHSWLTNIQSFRCQRAPPSLLKTFLRFVSNESAKVIKINFYFEQKCISPFTKVFNHEEGSNIP